MGIGCEAPHGWVALRVAAPACRQEPPEQHFYDEHIQPILNSFCVGNTSPCHNIATDPVTNWPTRPR